MQRITYRLRPISDEDIPQVTEIDHEAFPGEWLFHSHTSYKQEIHNSSAHYIVACIRSGFGAKLAREDSRETSWLNRLFDYRRAIPAGKEQSSLRTKEYIIGFAGLWAMLNEVHIIAIAVRNNYRRMGIGEGLLISTIEMASQLNANVITLEVRVSNEIAQALYKKYGFRIMSTHLPGGIEVFCRRWAFLPGECTLHRCHDIGHRLHIYCKGEPGGSGEIFLEDKARFDVETAGKRQERTQQERCQLLHEVISFSGIQVTPLPIINPQSDTVEVCLSKYTLYTLVRTSCPPECLHVDVPE